MIDKADTIFQCVQNLELTLVESDSPELEHYAARLRSLLRTIGEDTQDEYWHEALRGLREFSFRLGGSLVSADLIAASAEDLGRKVKQNREICGQVFPQYLDAYDCLATDLALIARNPCSKLLDSFAEIARSLGSRTNIAILVCGRPLVPWTESGISGRLRHTNVSVLVPWEVRGSECYDTMFVVGPTHWYQRWPFVFTAPRAPHVFRLKYSWTPDYPVQSIALPGSFSGLDEQTIAVPVSSGTNRDPIVSDVFDLTHSTKSIAQIVESARPATGEDRVDAWLVLLEGQSHVFLGTEDSTVLVIDLDAEGDERVRREETRDVEPGTYILLRTRGDGDYIVPWADKILGDRRDDFRHKLENWKSALRGIVVRRGYAGTIKLLKQSGVGNPNELNLRNWAYGNTILPQARQDFDAVMDLVGLSSLSDEYWLSLKSVQNAHKKAGQEIRSALLAEVKVRDLTPLRGKGKMTFPLLRDDAVSLTAYRVIEVARGLVSVGPTKLGVPQNSQEDL